MSEMLQALIAITVTLVLAAGFVLFGIGPFARWLVDRFFL